VEVPEGHTLSEPYDLSVISMPPEMYDVNEDSLNGGEGQIGTIKFFADDVSRRKTIYNKADRQVVPSPDTPLGWTLRSIILDTVHIFEVNRKECARLLLAIRQYMPKDTFKPLATTTEDPSASTSTISLESLVVSTILSVMFTLPTPPYDLIYYGSVITELCKLSPNTVAPPVGRAVRKLFTMLGAEGLDNEIARRAAEWFAVHLSNFGFQWMWKEWYVS
jgi:nuclear cap-binding protein subunit 1